MGIHWRRRSKIELEMPKTLKKEFDKLLLEGKTYKQVTRWCNDGGFKFSQSGVGRYGKVFFETYINLRRFEEQAKYLLSSSDDSNLEEAISVLIAQRIFDILLNNEIPIEKHPGLISATASIHNAKTNRAKLKLAARKVCDAEKAITHIDEPHGLSDEFADQIRKKILGSSVQ